MTTLAAALLSISLVSPAPPPASAAEAVPAPVPEILRTPLPGFGIVPALVPTADASRDMELQWRARFRDYSRQIRQIERRCLGQRKAESLRAEGLRELAEFTDPAAFWPMFEALHDQDAEVRSFMLDHFARHGDAGESMLAMVAIRAEDPVLRAQATERLGAPASDAVLRVIDTSLRDRDGAVANAAANLAGALDAIQAIPLLIFAQASGERIEENTGDLAWIAIGTQTTYVANLIPAVGDSSGAFQPVIGVVNEGSLLRVMDAVVVNYRTDVNRVLVSMTTRDWGQSTADMGYDMAAWYRWFNDVYVPHKQREQRIIELASQGTAG